MPGPITVCERSIDSGQWRARNVNSGQRNATREAQWPIGPLTTGRGIPPPSDTAGQSVDVAGRWARKTAGIGRVSGAMVHMSKHRLGMQQRTQSPERMLNPQVRRSTWPDDRPTSRAVGTFDVCSNSDLSYLLHIVRLKQPHMHCRADAVV